MKHQFNKFQHVPLFALLPFSPAFFRSEVRLFFYLFILGFFTAFGYNQLFNEVSLYVLTENSR